MKEGHISILGTGLSPNEPMAIVQMPIVQVENASIPDGKYVIKNRAADIYWNAYHNPIETVHFWSTTMMIATAASHMQVNKHSPIFKCSKDNSLSKWHITHDTNGNIFMTSPYAPSSWVGAEIAGSKVPVPWRLIPADSKSY